MNPLEQFKASISDIERKLDYTFLDKDLLVLAFTHRSFVNEHRELLEKHNERLEFLGDSVLGLLVSEYLYKYLPSTPEGELSYIRSRLVEASSCFSYMTKLSLDQYVLTGKGEQMNGRGRESILADLFEAILGAIYLDGGLDVAKRYLFHHLSSDFQKILKEPLRNWKAAVQDYAQKKYHQTPDYQLISEKGPDHQKKFIVSVSINQKEMGRGMGSSKKEAQQQAAKVALELIEGKNG